MIELLLQPTLAHCLPFLLLPGTVTLSFQCSLAPIAWSTSLMSPNFACPSYGPGILHSLARRGSRLTGLARTLVAKRAAEIMVVENCMMKV